MIERQADQIPPSSSWRQWQQDGDLPGERLFAIQTGLSEELCEDDLTLLASGAGSGGIGSDVYR